MSEIPDGGGTGEARRAPLADSVRRLIAAEQAAAIAGEAAIRWRAELISAADAAVSELTFDEFLGAALYAVKELLDADTVSFLAANAEGNRLVTRSTVGVRDRTSVGVHIASGSGLAGRVMATREPLLVDDVSTISLESPMLQEVGVRSVVAVPVLSEQEVFGVLHAGSFQEAFFGPPDSAALVIVADRLAAAMERVRLFASEREARAAAEVLARRLGHLQRVTDALAGDPSEQDVAEIVCRETTLFLGSEFAGCALWRSKGDLLVLVSPVHPVSSGPWAPALSIAEDLPASKAARTGRPVWIETAAQFLGSYPEMEQTPRLHSRFAFLPLRRRQETLGVLALGFDEEGAFEPPEQDFLLGLAEQAAQGLEHARLRRLESVATFHHEFVAALSATLGESLDYTRTLNNVVRLIVPELADVATIHLFDAAGHLTRTALAHRDRSIERAVMDAVPEGVPAISEALTAAAGGETILIEDLTAAMQSGIGTPEHRSELEAALAPLHLTSLLLVPLADRGRPLGVLTVSQVSAERTIGEDTRSLIEEVAQRAAVAIANTRLHSDLRDAQRAERFLLDVSAAIAGAMDYQETLERLGTAALPTLGDICLIDLLDDEGQLRRMVAHHANPDLQPLADQLRENYAADPGGEHPSAEVIRKGETIWSPEMSEVFLKGTTRDEMHLGIVERLAFTSYIAVPLSVGEVVLGSLTLVTAGSERRFDSSDVVLAERLAAQVAAVVDKARRYDRAHNISHVLQASLLPPELPFVPGVRLAARYLPGTRDAEVGGDFYDAVLLRNGTVALAIGDVAGHDHAAAATMGHLRSVVRTLGAEGAGPGEIIRTIQSNWDALGLSHMATAIFCHLDPRDGTMVMANAGHPPPLLVPAGKEAIYLPLHVSTPLGAPLADIREWRGSIELGDVLLFYTDGVLEERSLDLAERMEELADLAARGSPEVELLCDRVIDAMGVDRSDDVALLAVARQD